MTATPSKDDQYTTNLQLAPSISPTTVPPAMAAQSPQTIPLRRARLTQVQTSFLPTIPSASIPVSAVSASSIASSSQQASPAMSPESTQMTTNNSSVQPSPEGPRGRDGDVPPALFQLPESIVSRKSSQGAMSEALNASKPQGIIRRLSNRASQFAAGRRRQSSTNANNRDHSSGPVIMRRRSDSNSTAPETRISAYPDSDSDNADEAREEMNLIMGGDVPRDNAWGGLSGSSTSSSTTSVSAGPVIPSLLLQGTVMMKVSKKKKEKKTFVLDIDSAKVSWDKNRTTKCFYIDDIKEIRQGVDARNYRLEFGVPAVDEPRFFSILYTVPDKPKDRSQKSMHLIASDDQTFEMWTTTLDAISKHRHELMASLSSFNDKAVRAYWRREMNKQFGDRPHSDDEEEIDLPGVERLCRGLHMHGSVQYLQERFNKADTSGTGRLNFAEFQEFVRLMKSREDIRAIYRGVASNVERGITFDEFLSFLSETQCEEVIINRPHWEVVFNKFVRRSKTKEQAAQDTVDGEISTMNESALTAFLTSTFNVPVAELPAQVSHDRPMNEYFISSSHNTYLLGRQVAGESSVEAYISALSRGCRCVEIDCWNGNEGPVVMHGRTLTSQVSFIDVMTTIAKYAFIKTPYPLWISLEVHCSDIQQAMMASIIKETCGSKLVTEPLDPNATELPSPSQLLNRILIKVKAPRDVDEISIAEGAKLVTRSRGVSISSPFMKPVVLDNGNIPVGQALTSPPASPYPRPIRVGSRNHGRASLMDGQESISSSTSEGESLVGENLKAIDGNRKKKQSNIIKVLGELGVYSAGHKFHGFDSPEGRTYNHIYSFMEQTFAKHSKTPESKRALVRHNMEHMMRVYPNGWRVASTNFDPLIYWRRGVQMAALNWQTFDLGLQMNEAMFAAGTDLTGYVLKPVGLREVKEPPSVSEGVGTTHVKRERKHVNFSIDVISAQQLMRPKGLPANRTVDPYVEVEVYHADEKTKEIRGVVGEGGLDASGKDGASGLGVPHKRRTQIIEENGFNPVFDKKFNFYLTTKYPELVFVRFTVRTSRDGHNYEDKGAPLAVYTVKLSSLQQGYRTLPLMDHNGDQFLFSTLFCRIKIEPAMSIFVNSPEAIENVGKLKSIGRSVFTRSNISTASPKSSMDSGYSEMSSKLSPTSNSLRV